MIREVSVGDIASRHLAPSPFSPGLSEEFVDVIADMMEKDPKRRLHCAGEVVERLEAWASSPDGVVELPLERQVWTPPHPLRSLLNCETLSIQARSIPLRVPRANPGSRLSSKRVIAHYP